MGRLNHSFTTLRNIAILCFLMPGYIWCFNSYAGTAYDTGTIQFILSATTNALPNTNTSCAQWGTTVLNIRNDTEFESIQHFLQSQEFWEYSNIWVNATSKYYWGHYRYMWNSGVSIDAKQYLFHDNEPNWDNSECGSTRDEGNCLIMSRWASTSGSTSLPLHKLQDTCCEGYNFFMCTFLNGHPSTPVLDKNRLTGHLTCQTSDASSGMVSFYLWYKDHAELEVFNSESLDVKLVLDGSPYGMYACKTVSHMGIVSIRSNIFHVTMDAPIYSSISSMSIQRTSSQVSDIDLYTSYENGNSNNLGIEGTSCDHSKAVTTSILPSHTTHIGNMDTFSSSYTDMSGVFGENSITTEGNTNLPHLIVEHADIGGGVTKTTLYCYGSPSQTCTLWFKGDAVIRSPDSVIYTVLSNDTNYSGQYKCQYCSSQEISNIVTLSSDSQTGFVYSSQENILQASWHQSVSPSQMLSIPTVSSQTASLSQIQTTTFDPMLISTVDLAETLTDSHSLGMGQSYNSQPITPTQPSEITVPTVRPTIVSTFYSIYVGYSVKISCVVSYSDIAGYVFVKMNAANGDSIPDPQSNIVVYNGPSSVYTIPSIQNKDQGDYTCAFYTPDNVMSSYSEVIALSVILNGSLCHCPCQMAFMPVPPILDADIEDITSDIRKSLSICTNNLSSTIRKKTSAVDKRTSSTAIGAVAILILVFTCLFFVLADVNRVIPST